MTEQIALSRPPPITRSAYICAFFALLPLAYAVQAMANGAAVGNPGLAALAIAVGGGVCTFLLLTLNRLARLAFAAFWLLLIAAASYSWAVLRTTHDNRGLFGIAFLACCGLMLFNTINRNWPRSGARSNTSLERAREG
jgi:hypothetical protein